MESITSILRTRAHPHPGLRVQITRFATTGVLNTAIDFSVFNFMLAILGPATSALAYFTMKAVAFSLATINSYTLNKHWVFKRYTSNREYAVPESMKEKGRFLLVSVIGLVVNAIGAYVVFAFVSNMHLVGEIVAANIGALFGTGFTLLSNFIGYKLLVFAHHHE